MGGRRRVTAAEGGWGTMALRRRVRFSLTVGLERGGGRASVYIGNVIDPAAYTVVSYRPFRIGRNNSLDVLTNFRANVRTQ